MAIRIEGISKRFGAQRVLDEVSLHVAAGEMFVLLGASGSGKSTLLRLIAGLSAPDRGRIWFFGQDVTALQPQERGTGFVFQNYSVFRHMTVGQNIEFGLRLRHVAKAERERRRDALLDLVGLPGFASRDAAQLSGGQQQRVAIARALAYEPKVLLLDEPFGALDVKIRTQLRRSLRAIHDRLRITTVLVTHDQEEAFQLADHVGLMDRGRLVEVGRAEDLYARPRTLFAATFLGSGTVLVGRIEQGAARFEGLDFAVTPEVPHEEGTHAHLLVRPEDLQVSAGPPPGDRPTLGTGTVIDQSFAGALRRVRIRLARRADVHPGSSPAPTAEGVSVEALLPSHQPLPEQETWVTIQRWHFLDPPAPSLLVADDGRGTHGVLATARDLAHALGARVTILGVARDARLSESLGWRIKRRQAAADLEGAELRVRFGNPAAQILSEQADLLSQVIVIAPRAGRFAWLGRLRRMDPRHAPIGATILSVLENSRVPVLVVAGKPGTLGSVTVVTLGPWGTSELLRAAGRIARPLGASVSWLEVDAEGGVPGAPHADAAESPEVVITSRRRIGPGTPAEIGDSVLEEALGLLVVPMTRRGPHEVNEIDPLVSRILARSNRPVLVVPVARTGPAGTGPTLALDGATPV